MKDPTLAVRHSPGPPLGLIGTGVALADFISI